ncbi:MAG: thiamine diphosphokinase [Candidatus Puniceispirillaceae bacterium]
MANQRHRLLLIGGGVAETSWIQHFAASSYVVAVDSGLAACLAAGIMPDAVIGDLDSADETQLATARAQQVAIHQIGEQDTTDFEKALTYFSEGDVIALGFLGKRFDHALASIHVLARYPDRSILLLSQYDAMMLKKGSCRLSVPSDSRLSIWPVQPVEFVRSEGLFWPLDGLKMAPGHQIGTSNQTHADMQHIIPKQADDIYLVMVDASHWARLLMSD